MGLGVVVEEGEGLCHAVDIEVLVDPYFFPAGLEEEVEGEDLAVVVAGLVDLGAAAAAAEAQEEVGKL